MSSVPKEIVARKGDFVLQKWAALLKFIANTGIVTGPGVRVTQGPNGTYVDADASFRPWNHPFKVSTDGTTARVRNGLVNGLSPFIGDVRISGFDKNGREAEVPEIEITNGESAITYIAIVAIMPEGGRSIEIVDTPETFSVQHILSLPESFNGGGSESNLGRAVYPLAALYWDDDFKFVKRTQIVHHNLGHRYIQSQAKAGIPGRHLFWAA